MDEIELQARHFESIPLLERNYVASVHLEDREDEEFCNAVLQRSRPGEYYFISHSRSNEGEKSTGCEQCLKYRPYLSSRFFIFIDSDLRFMMRESDIDAEHFICQTYTYSWENHYCEATALQRRFESSVPETVSFSFVSFMQSFSELLYEPLLLLVHNMRNDVNSFTIRQLFHCIPGQCKREELSNNAAGLLETISANLAPYRDMASKVDLAPLAEEFDSLGIDRANAYLHSRGHDVFDIVCYIGKLLCRGTRLSFSKDILLKSLPDSTYWEFDFLEQDVRKILGVKDNAQ